ncbi:AAA-like domain-containing protein [Mastigocoleus testarum]|uniref:Anaphase-promoting complex subunit 4 WD40 domain-containing protein n=2 Tax=Mastigocoleus TaxID=996924 RepID=A0A0V7ZWW1_9CYAN|nr:AAA-like domain-containing protein [Mastigocoleus testarum]KST69117.1 hypothetical protein BC008_34975 [Mastigocoleus testarum BC008]
MVKGNIYSLGGTVQASKGTYISRKADAELLELCQQGEFSYILTSRQMGKSSLMISTASKLKQIGVKSVIIDLTKIGTQVSVEQWYLGLLLEIEEQLMLDTDVDEWWEANNNVGVTQRLTNFFQYVLLEEVTSPVVVFVDEIDTTLSLDFTDDFFAAIRYLYVARATDTNFERLSFVLIGVATPGDLIRDPKRTPFNIGQRLDLTDFSFEEAIPLSEGLGLEGEPAKELLKCVLEWTGGHPYLTQRLCSILSQQDKNSWSQKEVLQVVNTTFLGSPNQQDNHLLFVRDMLTKRAPNQDRVLSVYREIYLAKNPVFDEEQSLIKSHLKLSGVVRRDDNVLQIRNRIYQEVFNTQWVENELAQQRPYSQALMAWLEAEEKDESRLLRGQALQDALAWAKDKSLGNVDYKFFAASQELDKQEIQFALAATEKKAQQIVSKAETKAKRTNRISLGLLAVAIVGAIGAIGAYQNAQKLLYDAQTGSQLEREVNKILAQYEWDINQPGVLALAIQAGQELKGIVKDGRSWEQYPTVRPVEALRTILDSIKERNQLKGHTSWVYNANFSPDGKTIVTTSHDNTAKVWNTSGKLLATLKGHTGLVYNAKFSPDSKTIVTASRNNTAKVWNTTGKLLATLKGHRSVVRNANFSPDGKTIVTASDDNTAKVWDTTGKLLATLKGHRSVVRNANFSPDGKTIVTASDDNTAKVWDTTGKLLATLKGHRSVVRNANFSPDGKTIVTASDDNTAKVWDTTGKLLATLKGHTEAVSDANFSPVSAASPKGIGKTIVTASDDNTAKVWDTSGKLLATLKGHTGSVSDANFSPNGKTIITASLDNTAKVWHVKNLTEMLNIGCEWLNNYLIINPKKLQKLEVCQNKSNLKAAAPFLVQLGEKEAKAGNFEDAVATFKTALKWNRQLKLDPQKKAQLFENQGKAEQLVSEGQSIAQEGEIENAVAKFEEALQLDPKLDIKAVAKGLVNNANILVEQKKIKEAIKTYKQAQKLDPTVEINADTWNQLCRQGGLNGSAKEVMFACENAVKLAPNHGYIRYSRGLARALTGDYKGAIADLKILIAQTNNKENKAQRQGWVKALREGKNPFTKEVLEKLRNEG